MAIRRSTLFFALLLMLLTAVGAAVCHSRYRLAMAGPGVREKHDLVERLALTDLCLSSEASYTRHPAMADRHTPFQDHPLALEHFPSGALTPPPPHFVTHQ